NAAHQSADDPTDYTIDDLSCRRSGGMSGGQGLEQIVNADRGADGQPDKHPTEKAWQAHSLMEYLANQSAAQAANQAHAQCDLPTHTALKPDRVERRVGQANQGGHQEAQDGGNKH